MEVTGWYDSVNGLAKSYTEQWEKQCRVLWSSEKREAKRSKQEARRRKKNRKNSECPKLLRKKCWFRICPQLKAWGDSTDAPRLVCGSRAALMMLNCMLRKSLNSIKSICCKHILKCMTEKHYEHLQSYYSSGQKKIKIVRVCFHLRGSSSVICSHLLCTWSLLSLSLSKHMKYFLERFPYLTKKLLSNYTLPFLTFDLNTEESLTLVLTSRTGGGFCL